MRWLDHLDSRLAHRREQLLERRLRVAEDACGPRVHVTSPDGDTHELLAFCSNDYLGLASHPALAQALADGAARWGTGSGASHLISGHMRPHVVLEQALARLLEPHIPGAAVLTLSTGFMANLAVLGAVAEPGAVIFSDTLNHASIIDGAKLARAWTRCRVERYPHNDAAALEPLLAAAAAESPEGPRFIVTDGVFSMDGDLAPLPELLALAERHDAMLVVDDAHGFGVLGAHGAGSLAHFGLRSERLILMGTLGKAAGASGAFVAAHPAVIRWMINTARPYIYTTAASPAMVHAVATSLALIQGPEGQARREHLLGLIRHLRSGLAPLAARHGWSLMDSDTAIQPLVVGSNANALALSKALDAHGLWVPAIRPPTVPVGSARLRITLSAAHTTADVDRLLAALGAAAAHLPPPERA